VLVVAAGATLWYVRDSLSQSYFIAVADGGSSSPTTTVSTPPVTGSSTAPTTSSPATSGAPAPSAESGSPIQIYQGAPGTVLGVSTQSVYQEVCLSDNADVRLLPAGSNDDCHRFSTSDLTPAARGTLDDLPRDSYDAIQGQIRRLAEQTLPGLRHPGRPGRLPGRRALRPHDPRGVVPGGDPGCSVTPTPAAPSWRCWCSPP
jgi:hypothetical protein